MTEHAAMRIFGALRAVTSEELHEARRARREIRRDIIREVTSPANVKAVREQEHDRDLFAMHYATGALS